MSTEARDRGQVSTTLADKYGSAADKWDAVTQELSSQELKVVRRALEEKHSRRNPLVRFIRNFVLLSR